MNQQLISRGLIILRPFGLAIISCWVLCTGAFAANEAGLMDIWKRHMATPDDHDAIIKACNAFATANRSDPLLPITNGIEAWHRLKEGNQSEATRLLEPYISTQQGSINEGARRLALAWLSRLDREKVVTALRLYYRKEVAFPKSLGSLRGHPQIASEAQPPLTDRFGKPWKYELTGFAKLSGLPNQKYSLQSTDLGSGSELKGQLAIPYGSRIEVVPVEVTNAASQVAVKFKLGGDKSGAMLLGVGNNQDDLYLAFVGSQIVVVCDHAHWKIFPKP